jgi:hypothetical protein
VELVERQLALGLISRATAGAMLGVEAVAEDARLGDE